MFHQVCHGTPAAARVEGRDEGTPDHNHARRRQGKDVRGEAEGIVATPAQVKSMVDISGDGEGENIEYS